ncbi:hypothetical protein OUZ56_020759 [Daphnia magna]|uniref:Uncharacterized protein n=1 Tax=Daphnia magna TaxID=35525 RepID=A0ABQ9ZFD5_9CRUS|nr:hypothetical protein OUZ56_020759 [Daphnia magna]
MVHQQKKSPYFPIVTSQDRTSVVDCDMSIQKHLKNAQITKTFFFLFNTKQNNKKKVGGDSPTGEHLISLKAPLLKRPEFCLIIIPDLVRTARVIIIVR